MRESSCKWPLIGIRRKEILGIRMVTSESTNEWLDCANLEMDRTPEALQGFINSKLIQSRQMQVNFDSKIKVY
jgi:hypothetical protein